mmetsp:Transcript_29253/g.78973  ORF Transcript_29253/g.78973 Transcript_29253/m.78973 type:complete len:510 (-) Transcript_29253:68-1597(-)
MAANPAAGSTSLELGPAAPPDADAAPELAPDGGLRPEYREYRQRGRRHGERRHAHLSASFPQQSARSPRGGPGGSLRAAVRRLRLPSNPSLFQEFFPSHRKFMWHHTASYWMAVLFVQGALLFTFGAGVELFKGRLDWAPESLRTLALWPNLVGGAMFNVGAYCGYLSLINLKKEPGEAIEYLAADWSRVRRNNSEPASRVGTMAYFVGATVFSAGVVAPFLRPWVCQYTFATLPGVAGSACFVVGGVCELLHNGVCCGCCACGHSEEEGEDEAVLGRRSTCRDAVWWISVLNTIGGTNFLLGYMPALFRAEGEAAELFGAANLFVGSMVYVVSSWLLVVMWEHHDFGGALIRQLNDAVDSGTTLAARLPRVDGHAAPAGPSQAPGVEIQRMSVRGAFFIGVYCWLSFASIVNVCCLYLWDTHSAAQRAHRLRDASMASTQLLVVVGVLLVIALHSRVVSVPKEEPYRAVVIASRFVLLCGALGQTACLLDFFLVPLDGGDAPALALAA